MAILLMVNLKGGVAKTANAVAVAECLADEGRNVLLIDADHQCTASELLLGEERRHRSEKRRQTLHDLLAEMLDDEFEDASIPPFIVKGASNIGGGYENLHVVPCSIRIDDFHSNLAQRRRRHNTLESYHCELRQRQDKLKTFLQTTYEYVVVDCPSSLALHLRVLMTIADAYIIPAIPDKLSVRGAKALLNRLERANIRVRSMRPLGLLWSRYQSRAQKHRQMLQCAEQGDEPFDELPVPFSTIIPNAVRIAESIEEPNKAHPTFVAKYTEPFARLFQDLCIEIRERLNATEPAA